MKQHTTRCAISFVVAIGLASLLLHSACTNENGKENNKKSIQGGSTKNVAAVAEPPKPKPKPKPLVSQSTMYELNTIVNKWRSVYPDLPSADLVQEPDETTADYNSRVKKIRRKNRRAISRYNRTWRTFRNVAGEGYIPAAHTKLAKFIRKQKLKMEWECVVYDVGRYRHAKEVFCSTTSLDDWSYSAMVSIPRKRPLKKRDKIRFRRLYHGMPHKRSPFKPRLVAYSDRKKNYVYVGE